MSNSPTLPPRPSVEQLRKQAKELLQALRAGTPSALRRYASVTDKTPADVKLSDAQWVLAREYGFESWLRLVRYVTEVGTEDKAATFDGIARDFVAVYNRDDPAAIDRLNAVFRGSLRGDRIRQTIDERRAATDHGTALTLAEARDLVSRHYGYAGWADLTDRLHDPIEQDTDSIGLSSSPPFYRIDTATNTLEPMPPLTDRDWDTVFGVMRERGITGLNASGQMTDSGLNRLAALDHVTRINLEGCREISDSGLRHLAHMPQLEELDLGGYESPITDIGLTVLQHLPSLRSFQMWWAQNVTDAGVQNLAGCANLENVGLLGTPTGDGALAALRDKRNLRLLKTGTQITADGLRHLRDFPAFAEWRGDDPSYGLMEFEAGPTQVMVPSSPFLAGGGRSLAGLDGLFALGIMGADPLPDEALRPLTALPNLGWLGADPTDDGMAAVAAIPQLRMLMCQDTTAGDAGFINLSRSATLEYIWGRRCHHLTGTGFAALASLPSLLGLSVSCKNVDDAGVATLPSFPALREFMPMDVPDDGFRHIGRCERLEALWCMYCRDTGDIATEHVAGLSLRTYYAGKTRITDRSCEILATMNSLERITLSACSGVTDAGVLALVELPRLKEMGLEGMSNVTRGAAGAFPERVKVTFRT